MAGPSSWRAQDVCDGGGPCIKLPREPDAGAELRRWTSSPPSLALPPLLPSTHLYLSACRSSDGGGRVSGDHDYPSPSPSWREIVCRRPQRRTCWGWGHWRRLPDPSGFRGAARRRDFPVSPPRDHCRGENSIRLLQKPDAIAGVGSLIF
jgi:hypothetical protein